MMSGLVSWAGWVVAVAASMWTQGWHENYSQAWYRAHQEGKPLLVVLEPGPARPGDTVAVAYGFQEPSAVPAGAAAAALLQKYVLCHIDTTTAYGQRMLREFKADSVPFVSIIDSTGKLQIFRQAGAMSEQQWEIALATYQDGRAHPAAPAQPTARLCRT
jgi:hypothetical protein